VCWNTCYSKRTRSILDTITLSHGDNGTASPLTHEQFSAAHLTRSLRAGVGCQCGFRVAESVFVYCTSSVPTIECVSLTIEMSSVSTIECVLCLL